jgi:hypothetical protein
MLQVARVLFGCCICFTHTLQVYVLDVSPFSYVCCIKMFHVVQRVRRRGSDGGTTQVLGNGARRARAGERGVQRTSVLRTKRVEAGSRGATGAGRGRPQIDADKAGCTCEASRPDTQAL